MKIEVLKVVMVSAGSDELRDINPNWWKYGMQIVYTDKGEFIDHLPGEKQSAWKGQLYIPGNTYEVNRVVDNWRNKVELNHKPTYKENLWLEPLWQNPFD